MDKLYLDFHEAHEVSKGRKLFFVILGIIFIVLAIIGLYFRIQGKKEIFTTILYAVLGIVYIMQAYNLLPFKTKQFINIDEHMIEYKLSVFKKKSKISWSDVKNVQIKSTQIRIKLLDDNWCTLGLNWITLKNVQKIKMVISVLAKSKNIECK